MNPSVQLIPVLGSGGVGKTTTAAALALGLGELGRRVVVITVDPAHRLAQALGLESLSNEPVTVKKFENGGSVDALWLDQKTAFEDLVKRHGRGVPGLEKVFQNRLFKIIQNQLGGIEEYLGVERILSLNESGRYDICVLDTPPSRHALDFLEAPRHLLRFFDEGVLKVFLAEKDSESKNIFSRLFQSGKSQFFEVFKNFLGKSFLGELAVLLSQLKPVHSVFSQTAFDIERWTRSPSCHLFLISSLEPNPLNEARLLSIELDAKGMKQPSLIVLNKCLPKSPPEPELLNLLSDKAQSFFLGQFEIQAKLRRELIDKKVFGSSPIAELPRLSVKQLRHEELLDIGRMMVKQWPSKPI